MPIFDDSDYREKEKSEEIVFYPSDDRPAASDKSVKAFLQKEEPRAGVDLEEMEAEDEEAIREAIAPVAPVAAVGAPGPAPRKKARPQLSYEEARQRALMKLRFMKTTVWLLIANLAFFALSWKEVLFTGQTWFVWPLIFSTAAVGWQALRVFVLKGRDLRSIGDRFVERMIESELDRDDAGPHF